MAHPVAIAAAVLVAAALARWPGVWFWRFLAIGSAFKAKILCSTIFGSGRDIDPQGAEEVSADAYWFLRLFRAHVNRQRHTVTTSFWGLRPRTAIFRHGLGATLMPLAELQPMSSVVPAPPPQHNPPATVARTSPPLPLARVIDAAFGEPNPGRLRRTRAILVVQDGRIVAERYVRGISADTPLPGWSMTKSILAALVGILVEDGQLRIDEENLLAAWRRPDPRAAITVEDLLRMRSGLKFEENYANPSSDVIRMLFACPDTAGYAARLPLLNPPGTTWSYSSGTTNILSRVTRARVGDEAYFEWPRRALFDRLGMRGAMLEPDASGTFVCSSFMLATAREWAQFGQLHLQDGVWEGRRILPDHWVCFCTTPTPQSPHANYGAHWWLKLNPEIGGGTDAAARIPADAFFALGHEGQTLTVIPSQRLVIVRLGLSIYIDAWNHATFVADVLEALTGS
jgi:CubicO group peptidase (beta-lactamase class C family)